MPEGAECFLIAESLNSLIQGQKIIKAKLLSGKYLRNPPDGWELIANTTNVKIELVEVKGKLIHFLLENSLHMFSGLGMTGTWQFRANKKSSPPKYGHVFFELTNGLLYYCDARQFGNISLEQNTTDRMDGIAPGFLGRYLIDEKTWLKKWTNVAPKNSLVKVLMDQTQVASGIGNWVMNEILYHLRIHPQTLVGQVTNAEYKKMFHVAKDLFAMAVKAKGVTISDFINVNGEFGSAQDHLAAYNKTVDPLGNKVSQMTGPHGRTCHYVESLQQKRLCYEIVGNANDADKKFIRKFLAQNHPGFALIENAHLTTMSINFSRD